MTIAEAMANIKTAQDMTSTARDIKEVLQDMEGDILLTAADSHIHKAKEILTMIDKEQDIRRALRRTLTHLVTAYDQYDKKIGNWEYAVWSLFNNFKVSAGVFERRTQIALIIAMIHKTFGDELFMIQYWFVEKTRMMTPISPDARPVIHMEDHSGFIDTETAKDFIGETLFHQLYSNYVSLYKKFYEDIKKEQESITGQLENEII